ncbi:glycosylated lysosomal membrane protein B-like isoform X1 [Vespa mandarinia]|uniref:glycosylated lysosomal membrane protein B-like isoform X1 n=1 Tax=Vespa mandarinia TaxID=7446 RepID=UPI0016088EEE|nr:glycosylated lysosomal membrane protein B-like isoform X1 [Vespa mandarinia]
MPRVPLISLLLFFSIISMDFAGSAKRTLHFEERCKNKNWTTMYLRADGSNDTLHYLWDFGGKPSILMALTSLSTTLNIVCEDFLQKKDNSVIFSEKPTYTIGFILNNIIEFNDVNDTAVINLDNVANINFLKPEFFRWSRKSFSMFGDSFGLDMEGNSYNDKPMNIIRYGSIKFSLRGYYFMDHTDTIPHMLHTENATLVDLILDNIQTNESFSNSRFAIELMIVGGGDPHKSIIIDSKKNLDDEHTPGIFEMIEVRMPSFDRPEEVENNSAYLQWRPVSYVSANRDIADSTEIVQYRSSNVNDHITAIENSMLYCYYGNEANELLIQTLLISIGSKGDGFYKNTHYTTWTFIIGYGIPPDEQFSYLVIMIISIGLGLPLIIMFLTGLYMCIRNMSKRNTDTYLNR